MEGHDGWYHGRSWQMVPRMAMGEGTNVSESDGTMAGDGPSRMVPWMAMANGTMFGEGGWYLGWPWQMVPWMAMGEGIVSWLVWTVADGTMVGNADGTVDGHGVRYH